MKILQTSLLILGFIVFINVTGNAQTATDLKLDITSEINSEQQTNIVLRVVGGESPYSYRIFDKEPWEGGKLIEEINDSYDREVTFNNLKKGKYFICATDKNKVSYCNNYKITKQQ